MLKTLSLISCSLRGSGVKRKEERRGEKEGKERGEEERRSKWYVETVI